MEKREEINIVIIISKRKENQECSSLLLVSGSCFMFTETSQNYKRTVVSLVGNYGEMFCQPSKGEQAKR